MLTDIQYRRTRLGMKVLPLRLDFSNLTQASSGHLDQLRLVLVEPEAKQYEVGALETDRSWTARPVIEQLAIKKVMESFYGDL